MAVVGYVIGLAHFVIGLIIVSLNAIICLMSIPKNGADDITTPVTQKPKIGRQYMLINVWASNLFLGVIVVTCHVIESKPDSSSVEKPEGNFVH